MKTKCELQLINAIIDIEEATDELVPKTKGLSDRKAISKRLEDVIEELWSICRFLGTCKKTGMKTKKGFLKEGDRLHKWEMTHWNYGIIKTPHGMFLTEIYWDKNEPIGYADTQITAGSTKKQIVDNLLKMQVDILRSSPVDIKAFGENKSN